MVYEPGQHQREIAKISSSSMQSGVPGIARNPVGSGGQFLVLIEIWIQHTMKPRSNLSATQNQTTIGQYQELTPNTSGVQEVPGAGYVGSLVLAVRTLGMTNVAVSWVGGTLVPNQQFCGLRLQYAVGEGLFRDVLDSAGQPVEYARHPVAGHQQVMRPTILPADANDQPSVQVRWRYYVGVGGSGPRAQLQLDDLLVTAGIERLPGTFTGAHLLPTGELELAVAGSPHRSYALETTTDLAQWRTLEIFTVAVDGAWAWRGKPIPSEPARFYRLRPVM